MTIRQLGVVAKFKARLRRAENGCLEWIHKPNRYGYAQFYLGNSRYIRIHRFAFMLEHWLPPGMDVLHKCNNKICVDVNHLYAGTDKDNYRDKVLAGTARYGRPFKPCEGKKLTADVVREIRAAAGRNVDVGSRFGIDGSMVSLIKNRKRWGELR